MPKAILEFDLDMEEQEFRRAMNAHRAYAVLWDLDTELRLIVKYGREGWDTEQADKLRTLLHELLISNQIELYNEH